MPDPTTETAEAADKPRGGLRGWLGRRLDDVTEGVEDLAARGQSLLRGGVAQIKNADGNFIRTSAENVQAYLAANPGATLTMGVTMEDIQARVAERAAERAADAQRIQQEQAAAEALRAQQAEALAAEARRAEQQKLAEAGATSTLQLEDDAEVYADTPISTVTLVDIPASNLGDGTAAAEIAAAQEERAQLFVLDDDEPPSFAENITGAVDAVVGSVADSVSGFASSALQLADDVVDATVSALSIDNLKTLVQSYATMSEEDRTNARTTLTTGVAALSDADRLSLQNSFKEAYAAAGNASANVLNAMEAIGYNAFEVLAGAVDQLHLRQNVGSPLAPAAAVNPVAPPPVAP